MEFTKTNNGFVKYDENGRVIAEITYSNTSNPNVVVADHTFVDSSLRGQGVAGKLLDALVKDMQEQFKAFSQARNLWHGAKVATQQDLSNDR